MFPSLFILLYAGHLLADYVFQTDHQADHKADRTLSGWQANLSHAATHVVTCAVTLTVGAVALGLDVGVLPVIAALAWIGGTHAVIDRRWPVTWWMTHTGSTAWAQNGGSAYVDQTAHITILVTAALALATV
ncbi:DUF3307 domain-containing protein [Streptomyces sp. NPDC088116]|uniref:DUF3307 domain-containing protein n=1 Tax=Streptomyces sp. NPDC088116 TaxID=3365825 RepID=UPI00381B998B